MIQGSTSGRRKWGRRRGEYGRSRGFYVIVTKGRDENRVYVRKPPTARRWKGAFLQSLFLLGGKDAARHHPSWRRRRRVDGGGRAKAGEPGRTASEQSRAIQLTGWGTEEEGMRGGKRRPAQGGGLSTGT